MNRKKRGIKRICLKHQRVHQQQPKLIGKISESHFASMRSICLTVLFVTTLQLRAASAQNASSTDTFNCKLTEGPVDVQCKSVYGRTWDDTGRINTLRRNSKSVPVQSSLQLSLYLLLLHEVLCSCLFYFKFTVTM